MAELPKTLGRYEIESELGRGMMGVVYAAKDPALGRTVALKTINVIFAISESERELFEERFQIEARLAAGLAHPNVVVVHDVGRDEATGTPFIAFEHLQGQPLSERVPPPLAWREALAIAGQLADALHHAHLHGVVHRDIKPGNVMLLPNSIPKLMDFGVARAPASNLTAAGEFFGTPSYMSPEQATGQPVDGRSDLFSLGAVLYFLLTGRRAFEGKNVPAILAKVEREDPPRLASVVADIPAAVEAIVSRALAKAPADRYQDGRQLAQDIHEALAGRELRHARVGAVSVSRVPDAADSSSVAKRQFPLDASPARERNTARAARAGRLPAPAAGPLALATLAALGLLALLFLPRRAAPPLPSNPAGVAGSPAPGSVLAPASASEAAGAGTADPAPVPGAGAASATAATVEAARLTIAVEHGVKRGTLAVLVDGRKLLERPLTSQETRKALIFKGRKGQLFDVIDISAGEHAIRVEVRDDEEWKAGQVRGSFKEGEARLLEVRVGSRLDLEWR